MTLIKPGLIALACVAWSAGAGAQVAFAATTTFQGRFVCVDRGVQIPLAGAKLTLFARQQEGVFGDTFGYPASVATTGPDGEWSFQVPRNTGDGPDTNYSVAVSLDDGAGTIVSDYPATYPASSSTGTNQNDKATQDYGTQVYNGPECSVWLGLKRAVADYRSIFGDLPFDGVAAQYGVPGLTVPFTDYTTLNWPTGYPAGPQPGSEVAVVHEFWHAIRNRSLGSRNAFLNEISSLGARGSDPCQRTSAREAFNEGWPEFWAGDYLPAPTCSGVSQSDATVEGMVAWMLTRMEKGCAGDGRRRMVQVLLSHGSAIHTLPDFEHFLGCQGVPLDPGKVPRFGISPPVLAKRWIAAARADLSSARHEATHLSDLLPAAKRAARRRCPRVPCTPVIEAKIAVPLVLGQLAEERTLIRGLVYELKPAQVKQEDRGLTLTLIKQLHTTPPKLAHTLAKQGEISFVHALAAAGPLARRDHSLATRRLMTALRSDRLAFARALHGGRFPGAFALSGAGAGKTRRVPTSASISFAGFPNGTVITDQTAAEGARFGSPAALGFRGTPPKYLCPAGPTVHAGAAETPTCLAGSGLVGTGTMARLTSPAKSVSVRVGSTQATPGGYSAELDAFDARGRPVTLTAAVVGASSTGQGTGPAVTERVAAGRDHSITFIALYFNSYGAGSIPNLIFDEFAYRGP